MDTLYIPDNEFALYIQKKGRGVDANLKVVDGKFRWLVKLEGGEYIIRPIPKLTRWQHFKAIFS